MQISWNSSKIILLRIDLFLLSISFGKGNSCVDILAKLRANSSDHLVTLVDPFLCLSHVLLGDTLSVFFSTT